MPVHDKRGRALRGAPSLWCTLWTVICPYICPQAPDIIIVTWSVGASATQAYRIVNSASYMTPDSGKGKVKVHGLVKNKNKLLKMLGVLKDQLKWLVD